MEKQSANWTLTIVLVVVSIVLVALGGTPIVVGIWVVRILVAIFKKKEPSEPEPIAADVGSRAPAAPMPVSGREVAQSIDKVFQLQKRKVLTDAEFATRKASIIEAVTQRPLAEAPEDFLSALVGLIDAGALSEAEVEALKAFALRPVL